VTPDEARPHRPLASHLTPGEAPDHSEILDRFLAWVADTGLELYPEQEEAILELLDDRHVVLSTPTGSGKSLVAMALHWKGLCEGRRSFYTAPIKALVSEKFFALCEELGPENVGMLTGDASINRDAPVICCTTEVLSNMALRLGEATPAPYAVLDEFHYYADRERGVSWQVPLITLPHTLFLLMSATLGNTAPIESRLRAYSGREVAHVHSESRPVPLDFEYRETPLHETLDDLLSRDLAPVYVVSFTQRECAERAQGLTSQRFCSREHRRRIAEEIADVRFDTPYGRELVRYLGHGIGVHHAGLLPRYRLLVERLAQQGMLKVIFGTDTLGVGVNIPIRTVLFTKLCKYDGEKVSLLSVREFKQIAGRAGRRGFDVRGSVVCQAPDHVIENKRIAAKETGGKRRSARKKKPPPHFVPWNEGTFERLVYQPPEMLESRFAVTHGMILSLLQRSVASGAPADGSYRDVIDLVNRSHESDASKARQRRRAALLFRSLRRAGVVEIADAAFGAPEVRVRADLETDFSLHETLSLYLLEAASALDPAGADYSLELLSLVEAIQEDPRPILAEQVWKKRRELVAKLKAEGVDYDERRRRADLVTHDKPEEEFIRQSFHLFAEMHPWVREEDVRPKSIAREMFEGYRDFRDYVKEYSLARSEGLLLRYLSQVHNTLVRSVPEERKTFEVYDVVAFLRTTLSRVDSSLVEAWESLSQPREPGSPGAAPERAFDLAQQPRALTARVRQEMLSLVRALARGEYEEASAFVRPDPDAPWDAARLEEAIAPFLEEYGEILFTPEARRAHHTRLAATGPRTWDVTQVLLDPAGDGLWAIHGQVDLRKEREPEAPLVHVLRIGP
jgi:superfamily II RNA helicase